MAVALLPGPACHGLLQTRPGASADELFHRTFQVVHGVGLRLDSRQTAEVLLRFRHVSVQRGRVQQVCARVCADTYALQAPLSHQPQRWASLLERHWQTCGARRRVQQQTALFAELREDGRLLSLHGQLGERANDDRAGGDASRLVCQSARLLRAPGEHRRGHAARHRHRNRHRYRRRFHDNAESAHHFLRHA